MRTIYIDFNDDNLVDGWGTTPISTKSVEMTLPSDHPFFEGVAVNTWKLIDGELVQQAAVALENAKRDKDRQLNRQCEEAILAGFKHTMMDGTEYFFSYDTQAQVNFGDTKDILKEGLVEEVPWTVRDMEGNYQRIVINREEMLRISLTILQHKTGNIAKYRDELLPKVKAAKSIEEVESIVWE